jgi:ssDNA-binding Zn-finger/Zn-ribbon topoisomerase 1
MNFRALFFPRFNCPRCDNRMVVVQWSFGAHFAAQLGFEVVFAVVASALAAFTFWLFGQFLGFLVVCIAAAWLARPLMRYRCPSCRYEALHEVLEEQERVR